DLLARYRERLVILAVEDEARERFRPGDVGALADVHEERVVVDIHRLEAREPQLVVGSGNRARRQGFHRLRNGAYVVGRRAATAAGDIDVARLGEFLEEPR